MKSFTKWQYPHSDSMYEHSQMPGITFSRSDQDLRKIQKPSKMPTSNLLRLNSVGEVSQKSHPEVMTRKGKGGLRYSKSFDAISSSKNFMGLSNTMNVLPPVNFMTMNQNVGQTFGHCTFSNPHKFCWNHSKTFFSPQSSSFSNHQTKMKQAPRLTGISICAAAVSAFPEKSCFDRIPSNDSASSLSKKCDEIQSKKSKKDFNTVGSDSMTMKVPNIKFNENAKNTSVCSGAQSDSTGFSNHRISDKVPQELHNSSIEKNSNHHSQTSMQNINEENVDKVKSMTAIESNVVCVNGVLEKSTEGVNKSASVTCTSKNNKAKCLKRSSDADMSSNSNSLCPSSGVNVDLTGILFHRKTPKKGRPSSRKRKKRQHTSSKNIPSPNYSCSTPTSSASPVRTSTPSTPVTSFDVFCQSSQLSTFGFSEDSTIPPETQALPSISLFQYQPSDSESSDDDDEADSFQLPCDYPNGLSPLCGLRPALFFDTLFKVNNQPRLDSLLRDSERVSKPESELNGSVLDSSSISPSPSKPVCFSLSISVSDDEESDQSFDTFSTSPSEQILLDSQFGNILSMDSLFGPKKNVKQCMESNSQKLLIEKNAVWNRNYVISPGDVTAVCGKVRFAHEEDLVEIHVVEAEDRRGTWEIDGQRFKRRIEETEKALSHIFTVEHRQKIYQLIQRSLDN